MRTNWVFSKEGEFEVRTNEELRSVCMEKPITIGVMKHNKTETELKTAQRTSYRYRVIIVLTFDLLVFFSSLCRRKTRARLVAPSPNTLTASLSNVSFADSPSFAQNSQPRTVARYRVAPFPRLTHSQTTDDRTRVANTSPSTDDWW